MKTLKITLVLLLALCSSTFAISLTWNPNPPTEGVTQYKIYRLRHGGSDLVGTTVSPVVTFTVNTLLNSNRTKFYVTAVNQNGEGPKTGTITVQKH